MMIKGLGIGKIAYFLYYSIVLWIEFALDGIVWYGPLMVIMFTSCQYIHVLIVSLKET